MRAQAGQRDLGVYGESATLLAFGPRGITARVVSPGLTLGSEFFHVNGGAYLGR